MNVGKSMIDNELIEFEIKADYWAIYQIEKQEIRNHLDDLIYQRKLCAIEYKKCICNNDRKTHLKSTLEYMNEKIKTYLSVI